MQMDRFNPLRVIPVQPLKGLHVSEGTRMKLIFVSFASIYLLWGSTYLAIAVGLQSIPPFS